MVSVRESESAVARQWITGLEPDTWFWSRDIPVRPEIAYPVLSRLHGDEGVGLWKVARGLYWRGFPEGHQFFCFPPDYELGALMLGGPGAGLSGWSALSALGWTLQCPAKSYVSVLGKPPAPVDASVVYQPNGNRHREDLTWAEVTVLEALYWFRFTEEPWHECLARLCSGESAVRIRWDWLIRPEALKRAAAADRGVTVEILHRVDEIAARLSGPALAEA